MKSTTGHLWLACQINDSSEKYLFRYEETRTADGYFDECDWTSFGGEKARVHLRCFKIEKETPKGAWITDKSFRRRWIGSAWAKRYAHSTKAEAWKSFVARKHRQRKILFAQLQCVESLLRLPGFTEEQLAAHDIHEIVAETAYCTCPPRLPATKNNG